MERNAQACGKVDLVLLSRIPLEVEQMGHVVRRPRGREESLMKEVHLPLPPLDRLDAVALDAENGVASRPRTA